MRFIALVIKWILRKILPHFPPAQGILEVKWDTIPFRFDVNWYCEVPDPSAVPPANGSTTDL